MRAVTFASACCLVLAGCPVGAPPVGDAGITCNTTADCRPGEICDTGPSACPGCNGGHLCVAAPAPDGGDGGPTMCVIDGVTYDGGTPNPNQPCQSCQPRVSQSVFSPSTGPAPAGACGANQVCNTGNCQTGCFIAGVGFEAPGALEANNPCRVCDPSLDGGGWTYLNGAIDAGCGVCVNGTCENGCYIDGGFVAAGQSEPGNPCTACNPAFSQTAYDTSFTGFAPDGGCPAGAVCAVGSCTEGCYVNGAYEAPGAANAASSGCQTCDPTKDVANWTNAADGLACTSASGGHYCQGGACADVCNIDGGLENNGGSDPQNGCLACETAVDTTNWSPIAGAIACNTGGGNYCVAGTCSAACDISGTIVGNGAIESSNPCQSCQPSSSTTSYSPVIDGLACDAGGGTFCNAGLCTPQCNIAGTGFVDAGAPNPQNPDQCCVPLSSPTGWTAGFAVGSQTVPTGTSPQGIAVGDLNKDGKADLVAANLLSVSVSVSYGNGDGTFQAPMTFATGNGPNSVALADFNGDGWLDLAVANSGDGTVTVLLNQTDGGFSPAASSPFAVGPSPTAITTGNFKTKTSVDIAVTDLGVAGATGNEVSILLNSGSGNFGPRQGFEVGNSPSAIAMADFDNDGFGDLAVANQADGTLSVLSNNGNGTFSTQATLGLDGGLPEPNAVVATNFDGSGRADLAVASNVTNDVRVFLNLGGSWSQMQGPFPVGANPTGLVAGNFSGHSASGFSDLAVTNKNTGTVSVLIDTSTGTQAATFAAQATYALSPGLLSIAAGEFNSDPLPDLAAVNNTQRSISILLGQCP